MAAARNLAERLSPKLDISCAVRGQEPIGSGPHRGRWRARVEITVRNKGATTVRIYCFDLHWWLKDHPEEKHQETGDLPAVPVRVDEARELVTLELIVAREPTDELVCWVRVLCLVGERRRWVCQPLQPGGEELAELCEGESSRPESSSI